MSTDYHQKKSSKLTVVVNPPVLDFFNFIPSVWSTLAVQYDVAGIVFVTLEFGSKMKGNHRRFVILGLKCAVNT